MWAARLTLEREVLRSPDCQWALATPFAPAMAMAMAMAIWICGMCNIKHQDKQILLFEIKRKKFNF